MNAVAPPRVSVIVRSMDPPTLPRALASVALQAGVPVEVVLVAACGASHRPPDPAAWPFPIRYVVPDGPLPRPRAANAGLDAAAGEFITFLDHDDEFLPGHLAGLVAALDANPQAGVAYCRFEVYEQGAPYTTIGRPFDRFALHEKSYIHHSALLFRRTLLATGVRYDAELDIHDDWDFVLQLSERTPFVFVDQTTFRWHADTGTSGGGGLGNFDPDKFERQRAYVQRKWGAISQAHVDRHNRLLDDGMAALQRGALDEARTALAGALANVEDDADVLNLLAMVAHRQGDPALACGYMQRAVAARGDDARLWLNFGLANEAAGRVGDARRAFERVLALQPGHPTATQHLAGLPA